MQRTRPVRLSRARRIEARFLEACRNRLPGNIRILEGLLELHNTCRQYEEALRIAQRVITLIPDQADAWYNLGSCYAMNGRQVEAIAALTKAITMGYQDYDWMMMDNDLRPLRNDPHFLLLLKKVRQLAAVH